LFCCLSNVERECKNKTEASFTGTSIGIMAYPQAFPLLAKSRAYLTSKVVILSLNGRSISLNSLLTAAS